MRILYLCPDTGIDVLGSKGAAIHVRELIHAFAELGHTVDLAAPLLSKKGQPPAKVDANVVHIPVDESFHEVKRTLTNACRDLGVESSLGKDVRRLLYDAQVFARLIALYDADPPELLYVRASALSTVGVTLARRWSCPTVVELNAPLALEQAQYRSGALRDVTTLSEKALLRDASLVVCVSEALRPHVEAAGVSPDDVLVLTNGVDVTRFAPAAAPARAERAVLGFTGGLRPWHGVELLPAVLKQVASTFANARLVIAGEGPCKEATLQVAQECGVADRISFLGSVPHDAMPTVIQSFDVALAPYPNLSHDFYFSPLKVFEYLACGVPVVASKVGQLELLLRHDTDAMLVPPGDVGAMAVSCIRILSDKGRSNRLSSNGRDLVTREHTWLANAERIITEVDRRLLTGAQRVQRVQRVLADA